MEIRRITAYSEGVYEPVLRLLPQLAPGTSLPTKQFLKGILTSKNMHFFIAEDDDGQIAGMLTIGTYNIPSGIKVWIEDVVVDKTHRGKGIGEDLILFAIDYSKSLGADSIGLTSRPSRIAANELYKKTGFIQYETNVYKYLLKK
jgi:ribosomal protein S18 acetylase RimI-like enzyme